jgi:hypothetical protein
MTLVIGMLIAMAGLTAGVFLEAWDARRPHRLTARNCSVCGRGEARERCAGGHIVHEGPRGFWCGGPGSKLPCADCARGQT